MAKVTYMAPIHSIHGQVSKEDPTYFRHMYGKDFAVLLKHPRTKFSEKEKAYRHTVGELSKEASRINKDEEAAQAYNDWKKKGYTSRYRYILSQLIALRRGS